MEAEDGEYRRAESAEDAMLDCARYNDGDDSQQLHDALVHNSHLVAAQDQQGRTAMHLAAANGHIAIMHTLAEFGAAPDVPNHEGNTALHFAALNNQVSAARLLIKWGWHASAKNLFGKTPLQLIYGKQFEEMETLLLNHDDEVEICVGEMVMADEESLEGGVEETQYSNCEHNGNSNNNNSNGSAGSAFCIGGAVLPSSEGIPTPPPPTTTTTTTTTTAAIVDAPPKDINPTNLLGSSDVDGIE
ncbi:e3 ubiquitin-protein ligase MIB2 [Trypanosoma theileri]|uniref:E3 ubiquitin-protein ligase MIB2 n=1 Tax=Trypanosoma theileri TaxID=67003 RepID=A0A1X0NYH9_9TRYP|nr:e3 ubiquitin-protein ligase MIB2 [Trypanosoma theileri]ORC89742.1 e3 ubiquitin-protein ligase MIB2 [Trypanosoma theileri]